MNTINKLLGRGIMGLLILVALIPLLASASSAVNFIPLKPDSANDAPMTVFGTPTEGVSIGTTTAPATSVKLYVYGDIVATGTVISNAAVDASGTPSLTHGIYLGTAPNISTFTSAGAAALKSLTVAGATTLTGAVGVTATLSANGGLAVTGSATATGNLIVAPGTIYASTFTAANGNADISGAVSVAGAITPTGGIVGPLTINSGAFIPYVRSSSQINAFTGAVGRTYSCSDCTNTYTLCVATGTAANQYREVGTATGCK